MNKNVLEWKCPECGKTILSLYEFQLESNKESHKQTHRKKKQ